MTYSSKTVLVLEDQPLVALDIEDVLMQFGFESIKVISSCIDAEHWLKHSSPDIAIIDIHLRDGICSHVAWMLADSAIPFIVHSALGTHFSGDGSVFEKGRWINKPSVPDQLRLAVTETLEAP